MVSCSVRQLSVVGALPHPAALNGQRALIGRARWWVGWVVQRVLPCRDCVGTLLIAGSRSDARLVGPQGACEGPMSPMHVLGARVLRHSARLRVTVPCGPLAYSSLTSSPPQLPLRAPPSGRRRPHVRQGQATYASGYHPPHSPPGEHTSGVPSALNHSA